MTARTAEIIAHRGASADAPENTVSALRLGYAQGAHGGEVDVHLTKDGHVVVIHDPDLRRVAGADARVADLTLTELRQFDVGRFGRWAGRGFSENVPTLDEILALVPAGKKLFVEVKTGTELLPALDAALRRSTLSPQQTSIITFDYAVASAVKGRLRQHLVYWLHEFLRDRPNPAIDDLIRAAEQAGLDGLDLDHEFPLDAAAIRRVHDAGLAIYVWTLDDAIKARRLARDGIDGITTNRPGEMSGWLNER